MRPRRISAARVLAWREALRYLNENRRALLIFAGIMLPTIAITNLLPGSAWSRGFGTGFLVTASLAFIWWVAWVPSGLANRGNGALAELWTNDLLRHTPGVHAVIPSLKFKGKDVDHVVIASAGIVAIESKWRARMPQRDDLRAAAHQAADAGRTLRLSLRDTAVPEHLFSNVLIVWTPRAISLEPYVIQTSLGPVTVMSGDATDRWREGLWAGPVGTDFAEDLRKELDALAVRRDRDAIEAGTLLRWLARIR